MPEGSLRSLHSLARYQNGRAFKPAETRSESGLPIVKIAELRNGIGPNTGRFDGEYDERHLLRSGDLVFAWSGSIVIKPWEGEEALLNQHLFKVTSEPGVNQRFLRYLLESQLPVFNRIVEDQRTSMGHVKISDLKRLNVRLPPLPEQRAIAEVLGALDDKIESNRRCQSSVGELSGLVFRASASSETKVASQVVQPILGGTPSRNEGEYWDGDIPWASASDVVRADGGVLTSTIESISEAGIGNSAAKVVPTGTTLITARGTVGAMARVAVPMSFNQTSYALAPQEGVDSLEVFHSIREVVVELLNLGHGSVFNTINKSAFDGLEVRVLRPEVRDEAIASLTALHDLEVSLNRQTESLRTLRDVLLPELLSGRVRVPEARELVEEAS